MKRKSKHHKNPKIEETYLTNREVAELKNDIITIIVWGSAVTFADITKLLKIGRLHRL